MEPEGHLLWVLSKGGTSSSEKNLEVLTVIAYTYPDGGGACCSGIAPPPHLKESLHSRTERVVPIPPYTSSRKNQKLMSLDIVTLSNAVMSLDLWHMGI